MFGGLEMVKAGRARAAEEAVSGTESVRDRILNTARELFYREGARSVGVDTVVAQSGVAKTSLYRWFPSKDALIAAVIEAEAKDRWAGWDYTAAAQPAGSARTAARAARRHREVRQQPEVSRLSLHERHRRVRGRPASGASRRARSDGGAAAPRACARRQDRRARAGDGHRPDRDAGRRRLLRRAGVRQGRAAAAARRRPPTR